MMSDDDPLAFLARLVQATNAHDLDALVGCFSPGYRNETPAHPSRGFTGADQVRQNWQRIFAAVPDVRAVVSAAVVDGTARVWSEWEMSGTRLDGSRHQMCGVIVFEVVDGLADRARFYLEPVDDADVTVDQAVGLHLRGGGGPS